jgi:hypothetical protein
MPWPFYVSARQQVKRVLHKIRSCSAVVQLKLAITRFQSQRLQEAVSLETLKHKTKEVGSKVGDGEDTIALGFEQTPVPAPAQNEKQSGS